MSVLLSLKHLGGYSSSSTEFKNQSDCARTTRNSRCSLHRKIREREREKAGKIESISIPESKQLSLKWSCRGKRKRNRITRNEMKKNVECLGRFGKLVPENVRKEK